MMETIFDLPAHPLMVHFPIVAIPVLALLGLVMAVRPDFRIKYALPVIALGIVTSVATVFAAQSGKALSESFELDESFIGDHQALGEMLRFFVIGLTLALIALVVVNKRATSTGKDPLSMAMGLAVVALSILSIVWAVRTGHEGSKAVWEGSVTTSEADDEIDVETAAVVATTAAAETTAAPETTTATETTTASETTAAPETTTASETTAAPETTTAPETTAAPETTVAAVGAIDGMAIYESNCARCHGADGSGGRGPSLQGLATEEPDRQFAIDQIVEGGGGMPAFGNRLTLEQINAVVDYIYAAF
jgi:mono/diheme cytochrome c family protein/uncharacterized membrane protein